MKRSPRSILTATVAAGLLIAAAGPAPVVGRAHRDIVDGALAMDAYRFDARAN